MGEDAVRLEEHAAKLSTPDRQCVKRVFKIGTRPTTIASGSSDLIDVFTYGEPYSDMKASVLGRKAYIGDIPIPAKSWEALHRKVKRLLDVCNRWNLSISLDKCFWGRR